jgi:hypothetical protein
VQQRKQTVSTVYCDNVKFCVKISEGASETLALLILACDEYAMKKSSAFERHRLFKEGLVDVQDNPDRGSQKHIGQMQMWTEYESLCSQIGDLA